MMKVLNIGSLNIDRVYDVHRFVQKGETITSSGMSVFAGGKGLNQSIALARAGADVCHVGLIGSDGIFLRDLLKESGVDVSLVQCDTEMPSGHAIIQRDCEGDNCIVLHGGANLHMDERMVDRALASCAPGDWLLMQNETSGIGYAVSRAHELGLRVLLNPSPVNRALRTVPFDKVDCLILNEGEAAAIVEAEGEPEELLGMLCARVPQAEIILTLGASGAYFAQCGSESVFQPAFVTTTVDTTAAGDTFTGYFLAERAAGSDPVYALLVASAAASIAVSREGAAPSIPTYREVKGRLSEVCRP